MNEGEDLGIQYNYLSLLIGFALGFFTAIFVCGAIVALTNAGLL